MELLDDGYVIEYKSRVYNYTKVNYVTLQKNCFQYSPIMFCVYFFTLKYLCCGKRYLEMFSCKGYLIALQEFKRNEGRVQGT